MSQVNNITRPLFIFAVICILFFQSIALANASGSTYVLPYPAAMPGSPIYKINLIKEKVDRFWYFGDFGQFTYNLKLSDKYLVEAKTLFEYKQYLLAYNALKKSNYYYSFILPALKRADAAGKNITDKKSILTSASNKHVEELNKIRLNTPAVFNWTPEDDEASLLMLHNEIDQSIKLRL